MQTTKPHSSLQRIAPLVQASIKNNYYPGAIVLASHQGKIIYRGVFGQKRVLPDLANMEFDTLFDVASLTKVIVTTTAIMQLVEQHKIDLEEFVSTYWPAFARHGKATITVKQLLTHTSGLPADIPSNELNQLLPHDQRITPTHPWRGKQMALREIIRTSPITTPGTKFIYSDINFIVLGYLVETISREPLQTYAHRHIFKPLRMQQSTFLPSPDLRKHIAPTEILSGKLHWGEVHDPTVSLMGGVAGMAGLFANARDLGKFADMLLSHGNQVLSRQSKLSMTKVQTPASLTEQRGLGWDIHSPYSCGGDYFSKQSFGHTGWTGTSLWIDPASNTWLIILTSRTHPKPTPVNQLKADRIAIANAVAQSVREEHISL